MDTNEEQSPIETSPDKPTETTSTGATASGISLELGDIIKILAPTHPQLHENTFYISYINERRIEIIDVASLEKLHLNLSPEDGSFTDKSIQEIHLLDRSEQPGYARQNKLLPQTWIEIHFGGEISTIFTGEITNLEEDQIEVTTYPDLHVIYLDFQYKGLPENIPIQKIVIRDKPASLLNVKFSEIAADGSATEALPSSSSDPYYEYLETGEINIHAEETAEAEENTLRVLQSVVTKTKGIVIEENLEVIEQVVEIPENQKRYTLSAQTNSMLDELLSTIPSVQRSKEIMDKIKTLIFRYKELRQFFSVFDENGNIRQYKKNNPKLHKPLVEHIKQMDTKLSWVVPVVSAKKKIYFGAKEHDQYEVYSNGTGDVGSSGNYDLHLLDEILEDEDKLKQDIYYNKNPMYDEGVYTKFYRQLSELMTPFVNMDADPQIYLDSVLVKANLEAIVDNFDEFNSSVIKIAKNQLDIVKRKYVIQTYNLGLSRSQKQRAGAGGAAAANGAAAGGETGAVVGGAESDSSTQIVISKPDKMNVNSVVFLPSPVMNYSRIHLPGTNLLDKANLHQHPLLLFRLLKQNTEIAPFIVNDLTKELEYDSEQEKQEFLTNMRRYLLSPGAVGATDDRFDQFLKTIVPNTKTLLRIFRKYIREKFSFIEVVRTLEPFLIYPEDIAFSQYQEIRGFIIDQIKQKKEALDKKRKDFANYQYANTNLMKEINRDMLYILQALMEKKDFVELLITGYKFPEKEVFEKMNSTGVINGSEVLEKILQKDNGILFSKLLSSLLSSLMTPDNLASLYGDNIEDMGNAEKIKASDCHRRVLTKKYASITDLQKDNGVEDVYYDKEYDETPYHLLKGYEDDKKKMLPEKFTTFLAENLVQRHDCPRNLSEELAKRLIMGKKRVAEGEYAVLEIRPVATATATGTTAAESATDAAADAPTSITYYYRKSHHWVHASDIDETAFVETNDMFCNMERKCLINKNSVTGNDCESPDYLKDVARKSVLREFDRRYELSVDELKQNLEKSIVGHIKYIHRAIRLQEVKQEKMNNYCYALGSLLVEQEDPIRSPHEPMLEAILGQTNFVKKQNDIVLFYNEYCREPMESLEEDQHWKYCKETNTKVMPQFLYELAYCFVSGEDYARKLEEICHTHGVTSESDNLVVDKYSGYTIRLVEDSTEEGYTAEGYKISTHAFIEKDSSETMYENFMSQKQTKKVVCENERSQLICNVLAAVASNIDIPAEKVRDVVVSVASAICDRLIKDEATYNKELEEKREKEGIKLVPYKKRSQQLVILITASVLFAAVQTELPGFVIKHTMPGCVKSFKGFPLAGEEDTSGLKYIACVLHKMRMNAEPWDSISKMTDKILFEQMKKILVTGVLKNEEMSARYTKKREYLLVYPEEEIPKELQISKWKHFLPPIVDTNVIGSLKSVSSDFKDEFISLMKKGHKDQRKDFLVLKSKISYFSYAVVEAVQKIVQDKRLLLAAVSTGKPFLQNACCNESTRDYIPLMYFVRENPEIGRYIRTLGALGKIVDNVLDISKPALLCSSRVRPAPLSSFGNASGVSEKNIYAAFIHYCELDKQQGIPAKFHGFFTGVPPGYNPRDTLEGKIEFLKRNDKKFTMNQLDELMRILQTENIVHLEPPKKHNTVEILKDIIHLYENSSSGSASGTLSQPILDKKLQKLLLNVLNLYDPSKLVSMDGAAGAAAEDFDSLTEYERKKIVASRNLQDHLYKTIEETFRPGILNFLKNNRKMKGSEYGSIEIFLKDAVSRWSESTDLYKIANYVKNAVDEMSRVFPNILLTKMQLNERVHNYWGLSDYDRQAILKSNSDYYKPLNLFKDTYLDDLLVAVQRKFVDLRLFIENLPLYAPMMRGGREYFLLFNRDTSLMLLEYLFLSVLHEYILATNDPEIVKSNVHMRQKSAREQIQVNADMADQFGAFYSRLDEESQTEYALDQMQDTEYLQEVEIVEGDKKTLRMKVANLLVAYLQIEEKNKAKINLSYSTIANKVRKDKESEKAYIISKFEDLTQDLRNIEMLKKTYKLDEWNVGEQKGLFVYDKATSDRERLEQANILRHAEGVVNAEGEELEEDVYDELGISSGEPGGVEGEEDAYANISSLKDDFYDGQYYSDDE